MGMNVGVGKGVEVLVGFTVDVGSGEWVAAVVRTAVAAMVVGVVETAVCSGAIVEVANDSIGAIGVSQPIAKIKSRKHQP